MGMVIKKMRLSLYLELELRSSVQDLAKISINTHLKQLPTTTTTMTTTTTYTLGKHPRFYHHTSFGALRLYFFDLTTSPPYHHLTTTIAPSTSQLHELLQQIPRTSHGFPISTVSSVYVCTASAKSSGLAPPPIGNWRRQPTVPSREYLTQRKLASHRSGRSFHTVGSAASAVLCCALLSAASYHAAVCRHTRLSTPSINPGLETSLIIPWIGFRIGLWDYLSCEHPSDLQNT